MALIPRVNVPQLGPATQGGMPDPSSGAGAAPQNMGQVNLPKQGPTNMRSMAGAGVEKNPAKMTAGLQGEINAAGRVGHAVGQAADQTEQMLHEFAMRRAESRNAADLMEAKGVMEMAFESFIQSRDNADPATWMDDWNKELDKLATGFDKAKGYSPMARDKLKQNLTGFRAQSGVQLMQMVHQREVQYNKARILTSAEQAVAQGDRQGVVAAYSLAEQTGLIFDVERDAAIEKAFRAIDDNQFHEQLATDPFSAEIPAHYQGKDLLQAENSIRIAKNNSQAETVDWFSDAVAGGEFSMLSELDAAIEGAGERLPARYREQFRDQQQGLDTTRGAQTIGKHVWDNIENYSAEADPDRQHLAWIESQINELESPQADVPLNETLSLRRFLDSKLNPVRPAFTENDYEQLNAAIDSYDALSDSNGFQRGTLEMHINGSPGDKTSGFKGLLLRKWKAALGENSGGHPDDARWISHAGELSTLWKNQIEHTEYANQRDRAMYAATRERRFIQWLDDNPQATEPQIEKRLTELFPGADEVKQSLIRAAENASARAAGGGDPQAREERAASLMGIPPRQSNP